MSEKNLMSKEKGSLDMKYLKNEMWLKIQDSTVNTSLLKKLNINKVRLYIILNQTFKAVLSCTVKEMFQTGHKKMLKKKKLVL